VGVAALADDPGESLLRGFDDVPLGVGGVLKLLSARFLGWTFAGLGFLLGLIMFNSQNGGGLGPALLMAAAGGFGMYGLARGIGWVLKGFLLENPQ
jgi:hypothetical protein